MVADVQLADELTCWVDGGVDVASEPALRLAERTHHLTERDTPDNQEVDVARGPQGPLCR